MKHLSKILSICTAAAMLLSSTALMSSAADESDDEVTIVLSDDTITVDGEAVTNDEDEAVYISNDIIYYEDKDYYDSGNTYGEGSDDDKHTEEEAASHTVVNITEAGTYRISGTLSLGQIAIDLGDDAKTDPTAVVTLILDNMDITCTVAPAVIFYSVYECDTDWVAYDEGDTDSYEASNVQDTSAAGANVIIADGSVNTVSGSYVAKIYKDNDESKKLYKFDGAFYSKMSINIDGETEGDGVLNIIAENEGLDSELHMTINGGKINIQSQDDGINTNEDGVSVTTINGGSLHIVAGLGTEGDGIDSNGYLTINGGTVIAIANPASDAGLDSDNGSYINGGYVVATGSTMDWADSDSAQVTINLQFASTQGADEAIIITTTDGTVIFAYDPDQDETTGSYNRSYQGAIISCPELELGESYYVYVGGDIEGTDIDGLYDVSTVTGFSGATRQVYTGSDVGMDAGMQNGGAFGGMGEMTMPEGEPGDMTIPEGEPGDMTIPEGETGDMTIPEGETGDMTMPEGGYDGTSQADTTTQSSNLFYMSDMVNSFSGVQDETDADIATDTDVNTDTDNNSESGTDTDTAQGDIDGNGVVSVSDARLALRMAAKLDETTEQAIKAGDLDSDGAISVSEARTILRVAAKLETF